MRKKDMKRSANQTMAKNDEPPKRDWSKITEEDRLQLTSKEYSESFYQPARTLTPIDQRQLFDNIMIMTVQNVKQMITNDDSPNKDDGNYHSKLMT